MNLRYIAADLHSKGFGSSYWNTSLQCGWTPQASLVHHAVEGACGFGCGSCTDTAEHVLECVSRPALGQLRFDLSTILQQNQIDDWTAQVLAHDPRCAADILSGSIPAVWRELLGPACTSRRLRAGLDLAVSRFLRYIERCDAEARWMRLLDRWLDHAWLFRVLVRVAHPGTVLLGQGAQERGTTWRK